MYASAFFWNNIGYCNAKIPNPAFVQNNADRRAISDKISIIVNGKKCKTFNERWAYFPNIYSRLTRPPEVIRTQEILQKLSNSSDNSQLKKASPTYQTFVATLKKKYNIR